MHFLLGRENLGNTRERRATQSEGVRLLFDARKAKSAGASTGSDASFMKVPPPEADGKHQTLGQPQGCLMFGIVHDFRT